MIRIFFFTTLLLLFSLPLIAQLNISTELTLISVFNDKKDKWENREPIDEVTFLEFNKDMTILKHTTPSFTLNFIIKDLNEKKNGEVELDLISDSGTDYLLILNFEEKIISLIGMLDDTLFTYSYLIKNLWTNDD